MDSISNGDGHSRNSQPGKPFPCGWEQTLLLRRGFSQEGNNQFLGLLMSGKYICLSILSINTGMLCKYKTMKAYSNTLNRYHRATEKKYFNYVVHDYIHTFQAAPVISLAFHVGYNIIQTAYVSVALAPGGGFSVLAKNLKRRQLHSFVTDCRPSDVKKYKKTSASNVLFAQRDLLLATSTKN